MLLGIPAIWRVQGTPDLEDVQEMLKLAINLGVELTLESRSRYPTPRLSTFD